MRSIVKRRRPTVWAILALTLAMGVVQACTVTEPGPPITDRSRAGQFEAVSGGI